MNELRNVMIGNALPNFAFLGIWFIVGIGLCALGVHLINSYENSYAKVI